MFGFFHMSFEGYSWRSFGLAFAHAQFGLVMGILRWRSQSVLPGAVVHTIGNTIARLAMP